MLDRLRGAGLVGATIATVVALTLLIGLGVWQLERGAWKHELIARIAARATAAPVTPADARDLYTRTGEVEYLHIAAVGRFIHNAEHFLYAPTEAGPGYLVYTPLVTADGTLVLVNRGWVPEARKDPATRADGQPAGEVRVIGLARAPTPPGWFTPASDAKANLMFWPDYSLLLADAKAAGLDTSRALPFLLDAQLDSTAPAGSPLGGTTELNIPDPHLGYALTWFGLAATLSGVFVAFARDRLRRG